jgi:hypothetical protein
MPRASVLTIGATIAQNGIDLQALLTTYLTAHAENGGHPLNASVLVRFFPELCPIRTGASGLEPLKREGQQGIGVFSRALHYDA